MQLNNAQRELIIKVVYYGPGLSGKTTNLQQIHKRTIPDQRGRLLSVETHDDRTLFFDLLPIVFSNASGFKVKIKLFTVPGQVIHNATRRIVLQGADAIAFIADSRRSADPENNSYWRNLRDNLQELGVDPETIPAVIQYNKCDLPDARSEAEMDITRGKGREPVIGAVAVRGEGVLETLFAVLQLAYRSIDARLGLAKTLDLSERDFLTSAFATIDTTGTELAAVLPPSAQALESTR